MIAIDIPLIDIGGLSSPLLAERRKVAEQLGIACRNTGFFYVTGHGISDRQLAAIFQASRSFFELSLETKRALSSRRPGNFYGYLALEAERLDASARPDMKESFSIGLELPPGEESGVRRRNQWPDIPGWRDIMLEYFRSCWSLGVLLHRGFSLDLGLEETYFEPVLDAPLAALRLLHYPPATDSEARRSGSGAGEHTDYGNVTILAVDGAGGLELRARNGRWVQAPNIAGALICNIGDCLMRWTNDTYVSTPHRVTSPDRERYSVAFFLDPNPDARVIPVLGGEAARDRYPEISGADYLKARLKASMVA